MALQNDEAMDGVGPMGDRNRSWDDTPAERAHRLNEAIADIAYVAGCERYYGGDSRQDKQDFIDWAVEFEAMNEGYDWNGGEYIDEIEAFATAKMSAKMSGKPVRYEVILYHANGSWENVTREDAGIDNPEGTLVTYATLAAARADLVEDFDMMRERTWSSTRPTTASAQYRSSNSASPLAPHTGR